MRTFLESYVSKSKLKNIAPPICINEHILLNSNKNSENNKKFFVTYVSSFRGEEDVVKFIFAASIISKKNPNISFIIVGDGVNKEEAFRLSESLGGFVTFKGRIPHNEIPEILSMSDVLIALYTDEYRAIPIKLLEYAIAKKPIITSKNVLEVFTTEIMPFGVKNFQILYPVNLTVESIEAAIIKLYHDELLRKTLANNMYKVVTHYFSIDEISLKYLKLFESVYGK